MAERAGQRGAPADLVGLRRPVEPGADPVGLLGEHQAQGRPGALGPRAGICGAARRRVERGKLARPAGQGKRVRAAEHPQRERAAAWVGQVAVEHGRGRASGQQVAHRVREQAGVDGAAERLAGPRLDAEVSRGPGKRVLRCRALARRAWTCCHAWVLPSTVPGADHRLPEWT